MKKYITLLLVTFVFSLLFVSKSCKAQQPEAVHYTYKVFQAPNKNFGYDILLNGKIVYHEFASLDQAENINLPKTSGLSKLHATSASLVTKENLALVKAEHAQKAALLAIEKMKRKELPVLSRDEIKTIIAQ
jgi:hypothetical protein